MIRLGKISDLHEIMVIIKEAQTRMKQAGMTQWQNNYPNEEIIKKDISEQALFVYESNNEIVGTMSVFSHDNVYDSIIGNWMNDNPYKVIHRIAVSNSHINKHLTEEMINFVYKNFNVTDIRIDTHPKNTPMIKSLERQGFIYCGDVHVVTDSDSLRYAYQKHIS